MSMSAPLAGRAIRPVPLSCLVLAAENVRKTAPHPSDDAGLKASIANHGLLENLVVRSIDAETPDRFAVIAGGRRLAALQSLHEDGEIPADHPVPCLVADSADNPGELSLVENTIRIPMHPVDQVTAFTGLAGEGFTVAAIAARFGVTERIVEQRIRLGNVAPEILEAYRADEINLETVKAFAVTTDRERQKQIWAKLSNQSYRPSGWQVKQMLTEHKVSAGTNVGRFVGVEAYESAGGRVLRDLFADEHQHGIWFEDPPLLERPAIAQLTAAADELGARCDWPAAPRAPRARQACRCRRRAGDALELGRGPAGRGLEHGRAICPRPCRSLRTHGRREGPPGPAQHPRVGTLRNLQHRRRLLDRRARGGVCRDRGRDPGDRGRRCGPLRLHPRGHGHRRLHRHHRPWRRAPGDRGPRPSGGQARNRRRRRRRFECQRRRPDHRARLPPSLPTLPQTTHPPTSKRIPRTGPRTFS